MFLKNIEIVKSTNSDDFSLKFEFYPNEFFESPLILEKSFQMLNKTEPRFSKGTKINWNEGKNPTVK